MSPLAGPFFAAVLVLGVAGALKVARPDPTRLALRAAGLPSTALVARGVGVVELAVAVWALALGGRAAAGAVAVAYGAFAAFSAVVHRRSHGRASCGCFGSSSTPLTTFHVAVDAALATVALTAVVWPVPGLATVLADTPWAGIPFLAYTLLLAWLIEVSLTSLPELQAAVRQRPRVAP